VHSILFDAAISAWPPYAPGESVIHDFNISQRPASRMRTNQRQRLNVLPGVSFIAVSQLATLTRRAQVIGRIKNGQSAVYSDRALNELREVQLS
jgi:hypothetical protein